MKIIKKLFCAIFAFLVLSISFPGVFAQTQIDPMTLPKLTQRVTDYSAVLSLSQTAELNTIAREYENKTSNQLVVVLFPHRWGNEMIDVGMKLFTDNAIGQTKKNNGLLLIISTREKKIRIVVGYGLEGAYPDAIANRIIEEHIRPLVNSGDFAGAVKVFYEKSAEVIAGEFVGSSEQQGENIDYQTILFPLFIFGLILGSWIKRLKKNKKIGSTPLLLGGLSLGGLVFFSFVLSLILSVSIFVLFILLAIGMGFGFFGGGGFFPMGPFGGFGGGGGGFGGGGFSGGGGSSGGGGAGD